MWHEPGASWVIPQRDMQQMLQGEICPKPGTDLDPANPWTGLKKNRSREDRQAGREDRHEERQRQTETQVKQAKRDIYRESERQTKR